MKRRLRRFVAELLAPPKWAREAEISIELMARRRQHLIDQLESVARCA